MHGLIFFFIHKFTEKVAGGAPGWHAVRDSVGLTAKSYAPVAQYPDAEAICLLRGIAEQLQQPLDAVLEQFGEFLAPQLLSFSSNLIQPEWRTLDLIENTEAVIHAFVRRTNPGAAPPVLQCVRTSVNELHLIYGSARHLCGLAKGIIRGVARHYRDHIEVTEQSCMLRGDPFCALHVVLLSRDTDVLVRPEQATLVGPFAGRPVTPLTGAAFAPGNAAAESASTPGQIGPYRVLRQLGHGGMGQVYLAEDADLRRLVALKVMHPHLASDPIAHDRFLREARTAASIQHENLVTIYHVGQHYSTPFLAMQYLEGATLESWLAENPQPPLDDILRIGAQIAAGLAAAHRRGLVHRDIKPDNIWLEAPHARVKILDFGLARAVDGDSRVSHPGMIQGTPAYMSPEQTTGEPCDTRSDLYNLGVVLYRMCSGRLPFEGGSTIAVLMAIARDRPKPLHDLQPTLNRALGTLVMRLLAQKPADRPATADQVEAELLAIRHAVASI